jgi:hypothetical protein
MNFTLAEYLKLKRMEPGSREAVHMGCTCTLETDGQKKVMTVDPYCVFHWHMAAQSQIIEMVCRSKDTEAFNRALKVGYFILGLGMIAIVLYKF